MMPIGIVGFVISILILVHLVVGRRLLAYEKHALILALLHRPWVLRIFGLESRFVFLRKPSIGGQTLRHNNSGGYNQSKWAPKPTKTHQNIESARANDQQQILVGGFDGKFARYITIVVQQWSQIHPDAARLQYSIRRDEKRAHKQMRNAIASELLGNLGPGEIMQSIGRISLVAKCQRKLLVSGAHRARLKCAVRVCSNMHEAAHEAGIRSSHCSMRALARVRVRCVFGQSEKLTCQRDAQCTQRVSVQTPTHFILEAKHTVHSRRAYGQRSASSFCHSK